MKITTFSRRTFGSFAAITLAAGALAQPAHAQGPFKKKSANELETRISENRLLLENRQLRADQASPKEVLNAAHGIVILHQVKAGLGIGAEIGNGVALVRNSAGQWGAPAFITSTKGSWGFQIGADESITFLVLMTNESLRLLRDGGAGAVGVNLEAVAGPYDAGGDAGSITMRKPVLVYSNAKGAFAGASIGAGGIVSSKKKNKTAYGSDMETILFSGRVAPTPAGTLLIRRINEYSGRTPAQTGPSGY